VAAATWGVLCLIARTLATHGVHSVHAAIRALACTAHTGAVFATPCGVRLCARLQSAPSSRSAGHHGRCLCRPGRATNVLRPADADDLGKPEHG